VAKRQYRIISQVGDSTLIHTWPPFMGNSPILDIQVARRTPKVVLDVYALGVGKIWADLEFESVEDLLKDSGYEVVENG